MAIKQLSGTGMDNALSKDVKKHIAAIRISNDIGLMPRKMWNVLLLNAYDQLLTTQEHSINISVLTDAIGYNSRNYARLRTSLEKLSATGVTWDIGGKATQAGFWNKNFAVSSLLSWGKVEDGVLSYGFSPILAELLYNPEIYQRINIAQQRLFKTSYGLALWENCVRYTNTGSTGMMPLDEWRQLLGATAKTYEEYRRFSQKVLQPAIKEVNKVSNIEITLKTKRTKRRVTHISFQIVSKDQTALPCTETLDKITNSPEFRDLVAYGITDVQAKLWIQEHGCEYVREKLALLEVKLTKGSVTNRGGFLASAIRDDYKSELTIQQAEERASRKRVAERERQKKIESVAERLGREFDKTVKQEFLDALSEADHQRLIDELLETKKDDLFVSAEIQRQGLDSPFIGVEILSRIPNFKRRRNKYIKTGLAEQGLAD